jgi:hypothetical protein
MNVGIRNAGAVSYLGMHNSNFQCSVYKLLEATGISLLTMET